MNKQLKNLNNKNIMSFNIKLKKSLKNRKINIVNFRNKNNNNNNEENEFFIVINIFILIILIINNTL